MADGLTLQGALGGMTVSPMENYYGIGTQALGQALPGLVNPYGNFGTNLTYVLGGALLQGLLGYQARQEANRQNLEIGKLAAQMTAMPSAADRVRFLGGLDVDSQVMGKLTNLQSALQQQDVMSQATIQQQIAQKKALAPIELQIKQAQDRGMTLEEYAKIQPAIEQARAKKLAEALNTATTPQGVTDAAQALTASDLRKQAEAVRPTMEDRLLLSPQDLKQKEDVYKGLLSESRAALQGESELRRSEAGIKESEYKIKLLERENIKEARNSKPLQDTAKMVTEANKLRAEADMVMQNPDPQGIQKLITMANRIIEDNQTTLGELEKVEGSQPAIQRIVNKINFELGGKTKYSPELVKSLYDYVVKGQEAIGDLYVRQRDKTAELYDIDPAKVDIVNVYKAKPMTSSQDAQKAALIAEIRKLRGF